ncbi:aminotransferase class I/II-fold pyridoxal phosphate-dependent enzyme [Microvirga sp. STR05]|uniref:Aminotransferase class I/II-fold pyridoxal phosphate-dependent enzyme n=1 Tax=Hymenobacter duratus TaxID=2771356 RepID=A0ABR8JLV8_9BACT|nr:aminotransferase class I/II-fold pyridoxal phosphate-dependent enzyme [Hymenobacter duratus]MBD2716380.1 aminotransferase class I/II-fold pyridoxal phosphate-dependent enzyme [Hymenobacter duratus]MBR7951295.1 aminotransferase class I/II-fold pyridoxal phosphate-dependent enzyme [Microvirga sp. STR05]
MTPISLASGYGNFATPPAVLVRLNQHLAAPPLPLSPTSGLPELRDALRLRYSGLRTDEKATHEIVVTPGTKAALFLALSAVLRPGDEVLLLTPNWFGFAELVKQAGGLLRELPLSPADNYALRPEAVRAALTPRTRVLLFSNPNNPTGRLYTRPELEALLAVTAQFPELFVLADEIYDGIRFEAEEVPSFLSCSDAPRHIVVNGFSKSHALAGWNIGYLAAPRSVAEACTARLFATGGAVAVLSQLAALETVENPVISAALCQQLAPNRQLMLDFLATLPGALPHIPLGTYYAFPDLRAYLQPHLPLPEAATDLVGRLLSAGVEVVDGTSCGAPGFVRMSYAVASEDLQEALRRLATVLR